MDTEGIGETDLHAAVPPTDMDWDPGGTVVGDGLDVGGWGETWHFTDADHPHGDSAYPPGSMVVDTPRGPEPVGPATEDSNDDGTPDTVVVPTSDGILLVTDVDGDGSADQIVDIGNTGAVTVSDHTDQGRWVVAPDNQLDQSGPPIPAPGAPPVGTDDTDWVFDEVTQAVPDQDTGDSDSVWA